MNISKITKKIENHYLRHRASVKLEFHNVVGDCERYIFRVILAPGTRERSFFERASDIKTALQLPLFQPFRRGFGLFLAVSEKPVTNNSLLKMLNSREFQQSKMRLPFALGYDLRNRMIFADLAEMPHALYAGATNSGKSVGLICLILSLVYKQPVTKVNLILIDVWANTLEAINGCPHLSHPVVKDVDVGIYVIQSLFDEMSRRRLLDNEDLRKLPALVCVIDEYISFIGKIADTRLSQDVTLMIDELLNHGRHAKIYVVLAAQDPKVDNMKVSTGNMACMAFACANYHNSITILGSSGAEKLHGKGEMLFKPIGQNRAMNIQGAYMTSDEIKRIVGHIASKLHDMSNKFVIPEIDLPQPTAYSAEVVEPKASTFDNRKELSEVVLWTLSHDSISAEKIKKSFGIGNRDYGILDELLKMSIITEKDSNKSRTVIPRSIEDIPADVTAFLTENGVTGADIETAFMGRE